MLTLEGFLFGIAMLLLAGVIVYLLVLYVGRVRTVRKISAMHSHRYSATNDGWKDYDSEG